MPESELRMRNRIILLTLIVVSIAIIIVLGLQTETPTKRDPGSSASPSGPAVNDAAPPPPPSNPALNDAAPPPPSGPAVSTQTKPDLEKIIDAATAAHTRAEQNLSAILPTIPESIIPAPMPDPVFLPPEFDTASIAEDGRAVFSGRAPPGSVVIVLDDVNEIGRTESESSTTQLSTSWVMIPENPLLPGNRQLTLRAMIDGKILHSKSNLLVHVPTPSSVIVSKKQNKNKEIPPQQATLSSETRTAPLAVLLPQTENGRAALLQNDFSSQGNATKTQKSTQQKNLPSDNLLPTLHLDLVDYGVDRIILAAGLASADSRLRLFLNQKLAGTGKSTSNGHWQITATHPVDSGKVDLRVELLGKTGESITSLSVSFVLTTQGMEPASDHFILIRPGNSLWRIARRHYGRGVRYTEIFSANATQIQDPDVIYPGQIFRVPSAVQVD